MWICGLALPRLLKDQKMILLQLLASVVHDTSLLERTFKSAVVTAKRKAPACVMIGKPNLGLSMDRCCLQVMAAAIGCTPFRVKGIGACIVWAGYAAYGAKLAIEAPGFFAWLFAVASPYITRK